MTDALDGVTTYTCDEAGNKLTQTDAEGRTTRWTYDSQGRVLSRTLPMGQTESFTYDAAGNRLSHTDFNGQTTTDAADQILADYAYTLGATGRRTQLQEAHSGRTASYGHDNTALIRFV